MYYNNSKFISYADELRRNFNDIQSIVSDIEEVFDNSIKSDIWNSNTKETFSKELNSLKDEFDKVFNLFLNINNYLESVVVNYNNLENQLNTAINNSFSN